ncbi:hypothetical protein P170DRAFT_348801, partial [Aspergillus steynii IBT 23096]
CLRDLRLTNPRDDKTRIESMKGGLLQDSFCWVLSNEEFNKWRDNQHGNPNDRLLWIRADPGKGKTMLICGIIDELTASPGESVISYFLCQASEPHLNNAVAVLRGLIFSLVEQQPTLVSHIRPRYDREGKDLFEDMNAFQALAAMFESILEDASLLSTILIIDALDECATDLVRLLGLVQRLTANPRVKWVVSSRNWPIIESHLTVSYCSALSLELNEKAVADAVRRYIKVKVNFLAERNCYSQDTRDFAQSYLVSNANNTFLWAALVCDQLEEAHDSKVQSILESSPPSLGKLYQRMMCDIQASTNAELCRGVLAIACTAYRPLTIEELSALADPPLQNSADFQITRIVKLCGSFLTLRENAILFVHHSAKDFLTNPDTGLPSAVKTKNREIFCRSIEVMNSTLQRNIYSIKHPGCQIEDVPTPTSDPLRRARYACVYWIDHLLQTIYPDDEEFLMDAGATVLFLRQKLLYWLEALSLSRQFAAALLGMPKLEEFLEHRPCPQRLSELVKDICRFVRYHRVAIENSPLQLYSSALIFSPSKSAVKVCYQAKRAAWTITEPVISESWSPCLHTIEPRVEIACIGWSPDGIRVLCMSTDLTVSHWDSRTGHCISTIALERHASYRKISEGSLDNKILIWDYTTGKCVRAIQEYPKVYHLEIHWSGDGRQLASLSNREIRIWDQDGTAHPCMQNIEGLRDFDMLFISHDGNRLRLGSYLLDIIWDRAARKYRATERRPDPATGGWPPFHFSGPRPVCAPDGRTLAIVRSNRTTEIDIENLDTGKVHRCLRGNIGAITTVSWSPDGNRLASGSEEASILIWNTRTGQCLDRFDGHFKSIQRLFWDPQGGRLTSYCSGDIGIDSDRIRVWHFNTGRHICTLAGAFKWPTFIAWSQDGRLATLSHGKAQIWNTVSGDALVEYENLLGSLFRFLPQVIAWSPDGAQIACISYDVFRDIHIWNPANGRCLKQLKHPRHTTVIAWSNDGRRLASSSQLSETVRVWDLATEQYIHSETIEPSVGVVRLDRIDEAHLHTSQGILNMESIYQARDSAMECRILPCLPYGITDDYSWITWKGDKLLFLPWEYQPRDLDCFCVSGTNVAVGCESGHVLFLSFADNPLS